MLAVRKFGQTRSFSTSFPLMWIKKFENALDFEEPHKIPREAAFNKRKFDYKEKIRDGVIEIKGYEPVTPFYGLPKGMLKKRRARIHQLTKNVMQSGTYDENTWAIDFEYHGCWENPLMGWASSGDSLSCLQIYFRYKEEAIAWCDRIGYKWFVQETWKRKPFKARAYHDNFSWDKRTRVSTK